MPEPQIRPHDLLTANSPTKLAAHARMRRASRRSSFARWILSLAVLSPALVAASSSIAFAKHPFPTFDPAYGYPGASPPMLDLPAQAPPSRQDIDGIVHPVQEYADASIARLQDWYTGQPDGDMHVQVVGQTLSIGIRVMPGNCKTASGCLFTVGIDEDRAGTLATPAQKAKAEDRFIGVWFQDPKTPIIAQASGTQVWGNVPYGKQYPVRAAVQLNMDGRYHVEIEITLRERNAPVVHTNRTTPFGLAVGIQGGASCAGTTAARVCNDDSMYLWPNQPYPTGGQWIAIPTYPYTWATVSPTAPTAPSTGFMTYNVGLMPFFVGNGGDATPADFASVVSDPDITAACLQETWVHSERKEIADLAWSLARMQAVGLPQAVDGDSDGASAVARETLNSISSGLGVQDTGLLFLSRTPILESAVVEYGDAATGCFGADCLEDKGFIRARVGLVNSKRHTCKTVERPEGQPAQACSDDLYGGDDFVDLYCTHVQASCDVVSDVEDFMAFFTKFGDAAVSAANTILGADLALARLHTCSDPAVDKVQEAQFAIMRNDMLAHVQHDRPAIIMGDFNLNGRNLGDLQAGPTGSHYGRVTNIFGLHSLNKFEQATTLYTRRHDLGLGFFDAADGVYPLRGSKPVLIRSTSGDDLFSLALKESGTPPPRLFGEGTWIVRDEDCSVPSDGNPDRARYDHVWLAPQDTGDELPTYAVLESEEPVLVADGRIAGAGLAFSDHRSLTARLKFRRIREELAYNPMKAHDAEYSITNVQTLGEDCWGGEDWSGHGEMSVNAGTPAGFDWNAPDDHDSYSPNWSMMTPMAGADQVSWSFKLIERDGGFCGSTDSYDVTPWAGKDAKSWFLHAQSKWMFHDGSTPQKSICLAGLVGNCEVVGSTSAVYVTQGPNDESAIVTHRLSVTQK